MFDRYLEVPNDLKFEKIHQNLVLKCITMLRGGNFDDCMKS